MVTKCNKLRWFTGKQLELTIHPSSLHTLRQAEWSIAHITLTVSFLSFPFHEVNKGSKNCSEKEWPVNPKLKSHLSEKRENNSSSLFTKFDTVINNNSVKSYGVFTDFSCKKCLEQSFESCTWWSIFAVSSKKMSPGF